MHGLFPNRPKLLKSALRAQSPRTSLRSNYGNLHIYMEGTSLPLVKCADQ